MFSRAQSSVRPTVRSRALVEPLESRELLTGVADNLLAQGFVRLAWNGQEVFAEPGQWLVKVDGARGRADQQLESVNRRLSQLNKGLRATAQLGEDGLFRVTAPQALTAQQMRRALRGVAGFRRLEPDMAVWTATTVGDDPSFGSLWGLHNTGQTGGTAGADIDAPEAWDLFRGDGSVVVGVADTGIDYNHPDLAPNMWRNPAETAGDGVDNDGNGYVDDVYGWDFFNGDSNPADDNGHGTHVAGTIAAAGNNGLGVVGVNWNAKVMALKFLGADGSGTLSGAVAAVNYATKMRATYGVNVRVTNHSWGTGGYSSSLYDAMKKAGTSGILAVAAAGNGGDDGAGDDNDVTPSYPASFDLDCVVSVAATDHNDRLASFSNYGDVSVDLAAPGVSILSTAPGGTYERLSGTSMATPHVAGVAALAWGYRPGASYHDVRSALLAGADAKASLSGKVLTGGRLNASGTLRQFPAAPTAPQGLTAVAASDTRIDLAWADESGNEVGFRVYRSTDGTAFTLVATVGAGVTSYADSGLTSGTTYRTTPASQPRRNPPSPPPTRRPRPLPAPTARRTAGPTGPTGPRRFPKPIRRPSLCRRRRPPRRRPAISPPPSFPSASTSPGPTTRARRTGSAFTARRTASTSPALPRCPPTPRASGTRASRRGGRTTTACGPTTPRASQPIRTPPPPCSDRPPPRPISPPRSSPGDRSSSRGRTRPATRTAFGSSGRRTGRSGPPSPRSALTRRPTPPAAPRPRSSGSGRITRRATQRSATPPARRAWSSPRPPRALPACSATAASRGCR